ncbi:serine/threonine-protein kinase [Streptomyces sp. NPDC090022]|uniref:serine/threonine-protein kinase n=1 Tax=Streptomyces sp. NPDC090022 TaxID=3365920 RepID=UPI003804A1A3
MGTVWRATDELLGRPVAVKELHLDAGTQAMGALREARVVAQIRHPHVVVVHDVVEHEGLPCIVMELVEGGSLADRLVARGPLAPDEAARIGLALLGALGAAHGRGVLHRDVKPANVLLEAETGRVVLTDFGIARLAGSTTISETGAFVGSPEYTAPERMQGAAAGPASDLWSLGALLCAAVTGESPFHRDSIGGVLHAVVYDEIRPPAQLGPLLPAVRGLLERDPHKRLGAAAAERLLSACAGAGSVPPAGAGVGAEAGYSPTERVARPSGGTGSAAGSATPSATVPAPEPGTAGGGWRRPGVRVVLIAALVVAVAGGTVTAVSLLGDRGEGKQRSVAPATTVPPTATPSPTPTPSPGASQGGGNDKPSAPAPAPSAPSAPAPSPPSARPAPPGYRTVADPDGFSLAVPVGYRRTLDGIRVVYVSPDASVRIGIKITAREPGGPLGVMRRADANGARDYPGFRDNSVVATTHNGLPAALWEFTWKGHSAAEGPRSTVDVCWEERDRLYDVWVSAPVGRSGEARGYFDAALDSFVPPAG